MQLLSLDVVYQPFKVCIMPGRDNNVAFRINQCTWLSTLISFNQCVILNFQDDLTCRPLPYHITSYTFLNSYYCRVNSILSFFIYSIDYIKCFNYHSIDICALFLFQTCILKTILLCLSYNVLQSH